MECFQLSRFHLIKAILQNRTFQERILRIKVDVVYLKGVLAGLSNDVKIVSISEESVFNDSHMLGHFVALDKLGVEGVVDKHSVVLGGVRKVWPVKPECRVVLFDAVWQHCLALLL